MGSDAMHSTLRRFAALLLSSPKTLLPLVGPGVAAIAALAVSIPHLIRCGMLASVSAVRMFSAKCARAAAGATAFTGHGVQLSWDWVTHSPGPLGAFHGLCKPSAAQAEFHGSRSVEFLTSDNVNNLLFFNSTLREVWN